MQLTKYFFKKLHDQMKIIDILPTAPKNSIRLDPLDPEDLCVDYQTVEKWSRNNSQLLHLILQNGMAAFICNNDFLYSHYQQLTFIGKHIALIDSPSVSFTNLRSLNLSENNISCVENLPQNLEELYLDFNQVTTIKATKNGYQSLVLLSLSNNALKDGILTQIRSECPNLTCLNVAINRISDIRGLVDQLKQLKKLKILSVFGNPISLLKIYHSYITQNLQLRVFDGEKYVKPEPPKKTQPPKQETKQQPKQEKKDAKKDANNKKLNNKQPEPAKEQKPKPQPIVQTKKKQLTERDFTKCSFHLNLSNFEGFTGNLYDPSIFPADFPIEKTQSNFWVGYYFMGTSENLKLKKVRFDEATIGDNEPNRLSFGVDVTEEFDVSQQNLDKFQKGLLIVVFSEQPSVEVSQTGEQKPVKQGSQIVIRITKIGQVFVDLHELLKKKDKHFQKLYRLWQPEICSRPYFKTPLPNEQQQINKRKQEFEQKLKKQQEEKVKKLEEQEAAKNQKKGGKDIKKAEKKPQKKEGKQAVSEKKTIEKSTYPLDGRQYCYLNENKLYKARKQTLAVKVYIE